MNYQDYEYTRKPFSEYSEFVVEPNINIHTPRIWYNDNCENLHAHMHKLVRQIYSETKEGGLKSLETAIRICGNEGTLRAKAFIREMNKFFDNLPPKHSVRITSSGG